MMCYPQNKGELINSSKADQRRVLALTTGPVAFLLVDGLPVEELVLMAPFADRVENPEPIPQFGLLLGVTSNGNYVSLGKFEKPKILAPAAAAAKLVL